MWRRTPAAALLQVIKVSLALASNKGLSLSLVLKVSLSQDRSEEESKQAKLGKWYLSLMAKWINTPVNPKP